MSEDFENSIRNKLNEADIPFDQDAWKKMESLLDEKKDRKPVFIWWWAAAAILLGLGSWWFMLRSTSPDQPAIATKNSPLPEKKSNIDQSPVNKVGIAEQTNKPADKNTVSRENGAASAQHTVPLQINDAAGKDKFTRNTSRQTGQLSLPPAATNLFQIDFLKIKDVNNGNDYTDNIYLNNNNDYTKIDTIPVTYHSAAFTKVDSTAPVRNKGKLKNWYIGLTLGPDLSVAPSLKYGNIGFSGGVLFHYYFNRKLFATTGVMYSKKIYGATPKDYGRANTGTGAYALTRVDANCDVLDIPINMNYTFLSAGKNKVSATLGLSNYFMLKEKYQYIYEYAPKWEKTVENQNQHYLSVLNVGLLYQRPVTHGLLLGVQPYAKIPLRGVGYGQVKLYSAGLSIQMTFTGKKP